ncbi:hypothetical protein EWB00_004146, partial [Schistosoma japonicum]
MAHYSTFGVTYWHAMKGGNTFRFLKYRDEIKKKVVVSFKTNCFDDDNNLDSYFASAVEKWTDSSSSEQFLTFRRKISPYVLSLKLIIFHQDLICRELKVFWEQLDDACLPPALELCLGVVLVELLLGVGEKVHATSLEVLPRLLDSIFSSNCGNKQHPHLIYDDCEGKNQILSSYNTTSKLGISSKDLSIDPKILTAVSYSLSQLAKRNPSAEQISYVIQHLTLQCQCLSTENSQYFSEYVSLLTSFLQSIAQSDFMPLFEENISQILTILTNCYSSRDVINLCCLFLQSTSGRYNPYHFIKSVIQNKTQETEGRFEFLKELAKYPKFDKEVSPNLIHLLLDIYSQRTSNSISSQSFCVFDSVFRIALIKQLILDEPNTVDNTYSFFIDFTCDVRNVIDWFLSPLFLLSNRNVTSYRKCCGCSHEFQVPLSIPIFCLSRVRPLPVEITLNLLIGAIKQLADDIHCSNESNI